MSTSLVLSSAKPKVWSSPVLVLGDWSVRRRLGILKQVPLEGRSALLDRRPMICKANSFFVESQETISGHFRFLNSVCPVLFKGPGHHFKGHMFFCLMWYLGVHWKAWFSCFWCQSTRSSWHPTPPSPVFAEALPFCMYVHMYVFLCLCTWVWV